MIPKPKFLPLETRKVDGLRHLVQWQTGKYDLRVVHSEHAELKTDGVSVWIPFIPNDVYERYSRVLFGGTIHEGAHIKRSDFKLKASIRNGLEGSFTNAIEDFRIEHYECLERPSLNHEFKTNRDYYTEKTREKFGHIDPDQLELACMTNPVVFTTLFGVMMYQYLWEEDVSMYPAFLQKILETVKEDLANFKTTMVDGPEGSHQAYQTAKEIIAKLQSVFDKMKEFYDKMKEAANEKEEGEQQEGDQADEESKGKGSKGEDDEEGEGDEGEDGEEGEGEEGDESGAGEDEGEEYEDEGSGSEEGEEEGEEGEEGEESDEGTGKAKKGPAGSGDDEGEDEEFDGDDEGEDGSFDSDLPDSNDGGVDESKKPSPQITTKKGSPDDGEDREEEDFDDILSKPHEQNAPKFKTEIRGSIHEKDAKVLKGGEEGEEGETCSGTMSDELLEEMFSALKDKHGSLVMSKIFDEQDSGGGGLSAHRLLEAAAKAGVKDIYQEVYEVLRSKIITDSCASRQHMPHPFFLNLDQEKPANVPLTDANREQYSKMRKAVEKDISLLRTKLLGFIMAEKRVHFLPDAEEGEIDVAALWSLPHGNTRIFQEFTRGRKLNTAIEVLIDCSGSMAERNKYIGATKAAIAMGEVFSIIKVPFEMCGFTTRGNDFAIGTITDEERQIYNRAESLLHIIFKSFEETFHTAKHNLLAINALTNNCDGESLRWAARRLLRRKEQRKILFVLSDGEPHCSCSSKAGGVRLLREDLRLAVKEVIAEGVECYGIGIYDTGPKHYYPDCSIISETEENIAKAIFECLAKKLHKAI